ncbi:hypothetical protein P691DRAFT_251938 [Macrolepiota fuliginosa MF-IS2]|uniref:Uncharacterized protein n=1 Tax=Macrolepiota fuliginosa MF-IS2 TaxID=1400762 RepID=A0A9P5X808_9AGAR|nr:hypothetical protein P691DRAFT_251938 [Macrolepiota fuliginosa MF-IS2]
MSRGHIGHSDDHCDSPSNPSKASDPEPAVATVSPNKYRPTSCTPVPEPAPQCSEAEAEARVITADRVEGSPSSVPEPLSKEPPPKAFHALLSEDPSPADPLPAKPTQAEVPLPTRPMSGAESQPEETDGAVEEVLPVPESRPQTPVLQKSPDSDPFRFPSPDPGSFSSKLGVTAYNLYGLDTFDNSSPAKSLSSLAGSDSELDDDDDEDEQTLDRITIPKDVHLLDVEFAPQFTSTQKRSNSLDVNSTSGITSDALWANEKLPSTSQLQAEVNSQVDGFDKFMAADLSLDVVTPDL